MLTPKLAAPIPMSFFQKAVKSAPSALPAVAGKAVASPFAHAAQSAGATLAKKPPPLPMRAMSGPVMRPMGQQSMSVHGSVDFGTMSDALIDELFKIAESKKEDMGSPGMAGILSYLGGHAVGAPITAGIGGYRGYERGHRHGEGTEGAVRGAAGSAGGAILGDRIGSHLGRHSKAGRIAGHLIGSAAGSDLGTRALTHKYKKLDKEKKGEDLTEAARSHIAKKNFAVSAKASNTGKPAYPIPDKAHARAALGFAAMHHDKKDLAEVRKDVARKFPDMNVGGEKKGSAFGQALQEHFKEASLAGRLGKA